MLLNINDYSFGLQTDQLPGNEGKQKVRVGPNAHVPS